MNIKDMEVMYMKNMVVKRMKNRVMRRDFKKKCKINRIYFYLKKFSYQGYLEASKLKNLWYLNKLE